MHVGASCDPGIFSRRLCLVLTFIVVTLCHFTLTSHNSLMLKITTDKVSSTTPTTSEELSGEPTITEPPTVRSVTTAPTAVTTAPTAVPLNSHERNSSSVSQVPAVLARGNRCIQLQESRKIRPHQSWGNSSKSERNEWVVLRCDEAIGIKVCSELKKTYGVIPGTTWGRLSGKKRKEWRRMMCDQYAESSHNKYLTDQEINQAVAWLDSFASTQCETLALCPRAQQVAGYSSLTHQGKLQAVILRLLKILLLFSNMPEHKSHMKWHVAWGTILGAARHRGFIPWDHDVDVLISKESISYLIDHMADLPSDITLQHKTTENRYSRTFIPLTMRDLNSCYNNQDSGPVGYKHHNGLQIDFFSSENPFLYKPKPGDFVVDKSPMLFHTLGVPVPPMPVWKRQLTHHLQQSYEEFMRVVARLPELSIASPDQACPYPSVGGDQDIIYNGTLWIRK